MTINEAKFNNEDELHSWVSENLEIFLPGSKYLPGKYITTISGKRGLPDGFAYNLSERIWYLLESELLSHGVWPHIAEQLTRFVVAVQNPESRRIIRDLMFDAIIEDNKVLACEVLNTTPERLLQQVELFVEGIDPEVIVFIDETNQDLHDMAHALSAQVKIYRVKKYIVNGNTEYHSPDRNIPILVTEPVIEHGASTSEFEVIEALGGGELGTSTSRFKFYRMDDGSIIHIKRSKFHERQNYYWYGVTTTSLEHIEQNEITHIVFVMGGEGFVKVPIDLVMGFLKNTRVSHNEDGSIRHYHCLISPGPDSELFYSQEVPSFDISEYYQTF